jgi:hypothetical protein
MIFRAWGDIRLMHHERFIQILSISNLGGQAQSKFCPEIIFIVDNQFILMLHLSSIEWSLFRVGTSSACKYLRSQEYENATGGSPRERIFHEI